MRLEYPPLNNGGTVSGPLILGTDPGGSDILRVGGSVRASGAVSGLNGQFGTVTAPLPKVVAIGYGVGAGPTSYGVAAIDYGSGFKTLELQGAGGGVTIGTDPGGSELLRVGGAIREKVADATIGAVFSGATGKLDVYPYYDASLGTYFTTALTDNSAYTPLSIQSSRFDFYVAGVGKYLSLGTSGLVLGTDPGGSELLRVGGSIRCAAVTASNTIASTSNVTPGAGVALSSLTLGRDATSGGWLQGYGAAAVEALRLNPLGGSVIIGTDPGGSELLRVGGSVRCKTDLVAEGNLHIGYGSGVDCRYTFDGSGASIGTWSNYPLKFLTNGSIRLTLAAADGAATFVSSVGCVGLTSSDTISASGGGAQTVLSFGTGYGTIGTNSNHPLYLIANGGHKATLNTDGSFVINPAADPGGSELLRVGGSVGLATGNGLYIGGFARIAGATTVTNFYSGSSSLNFYSQDSASLLASLSNTTGDFATYAKISCATSATVSDKVRMHYDASTGERGMQVKLINKTGAATVKGTICSTTTTDMAFALTPGDAYDPAFVVYEAGVADGTEAWVWCIGSVCEVLLKDGTAATRDYWVKISDTAGRADATNASPPGGTIAALEDHGREVGHALESKTSGTSVLAKITFHLN